MKNVESNTRLGLGLSGGGFRASFYHIGVLAKMAELGMLKHVESISTVSGGSIVGVAYYLLVKDLLEREADASITDRDYVGLVERLEVHFLDAIQKNLRMRTFTNPIKNLRMSKADYSRSDAIGELYEKYIYKPLLDVGDRRINMSDLLIQPAGVTGDFHPGDDNIGNRARVNKVPVLILNATSLNSGHNWIFTATSMGEVPPRNYNFRDIDKKDRYRRVRYEDIKTRRPNFRLGSAVAASAGVPGLFPPMAVSNLYEDRRVQLVDGGVYDNQGIAGLLDPEALCTDFIVSDASGQSDAEDNPATEVFPVLINSSGILSGRVREEMVNSLELTQPNNVAYFHLKRGLFAKDIEFNQGGVSASAGVKMSAGIVGSETEFDVTQAAQTALAHIRTDLDSFTDVEAGCLQADGYQMSEPRLVKMSRYISPNRLSGNWQFGRYLTALKMGEQRALTQLRLGRHQFLKPLFYVLGGATTFAKAIKLVLVSLPVVASLILIFALIDWALKTYLGFDIWKIVTNISAFEAFIFNVAEYFYYFLALYLLSKAADFLIRGSGHWMKILQKVLKGPMSFITGILTRAILPIIFAIPIIIYIYTIDQYFIKHMGRLD
jgi:NTE family protein